MSRINTNTIATSDGNNVALDSALNLKSYTTTQRNALTSTAGDMIYNTTDNKVQTYNGSSWDDLGNPFTDIDFLVIAGGGAGAFNDNGGGYASGGGGAGGYRTSYGTGNVSGGSSPVETAYKVLVDGSTTYTITIGAGSSTYRQPASNSQFADIISYGGGSSDRNNSFNGNNGGSASGVTGFPSSNIGYGLAGQGSNGGASSTAGGGGGGAGGVGANATSQTAPGAGGTGLSSSITGSAVDRAGGGGGGAGGTGTGAAGGTGGGGAGANGTNNATVGNTGTAGTINTGGGGGGGSGGTSAGSIANGGSGVVILRYATADATISIGAGLTSTSTTDGSDTIVTFTAGTDTVTFS